MTTLSECLMYAVFGGALVVAAGIIADFGWHVWTDDHRK